MDRESLRRMEQVYGEGQVDLGGHGVPMSTSPLIEQILPEDRANEAEAIYDSEKLQRWFKEHDMPMLDFGGNEYGITAEMIAAVSYKLLRSVKFSNGRIFGKERAQDILARAKEAVRQDPYL